MRRSAATARGASFKSTLEFAQQQRQRRFAVEFEHEVALGAVTRRAWPIGWQPCVTRDTSATSALNATPDKPPSNTPSAKVSVRARELARPPNR